MSVSIRLKRFGAKKRPYYRVVVMDSRTPSDSRTIDEIGFYNPIESEEKQIQIDTEKAKSWIMKGAQPSATVKKILNSQGVNLSRNTAE